jgi:KTSC domain
MNARRSIRRMKQRVRLDSSAIEAVRYDQKKQTLDVEFREGHSYRYVHVPEFVYRELLNAESAGSFWNAVKDRFEYIKLD